MTKPLFANINCVSNSVPETPAHDKTRLRERFFIKIFHKRPVMVARPSI